MLNFILVFLAYIGELMSEFRIGSDFLTPLAVDHLKRVQSVMHNNIVSLTAMDVVYRMIDFAIHKGLAAQLVVRLLFGHV
jgi:hypothetical protein